MKHRWIGRNIDLEKLAKNIVKFFEKLNFKAKKERKLKTITLNFKTVDKGKTRCIIIKITGKPSDFTISFENPFEHDLFLENTFFWQFMGAGFLLLKKYEDREFYQKIEEYFWCDIERIIAECFL
mgnify:CR=1 FL=1